MADDQQDNSSGDIISDSLLESGRVRDEFINSGEYHPDVVKRIKAERFIAEFGTAQKPNEGLFLQPEKSILLAPIADTIPKVTENLTTVFDGHRLSTPSEALTPYQKSVREFILANQNAFPDTFFYMPDLQSFTDMAIVPDGSTKLTINSSRFSDFYPEYLAHAENLGIDLSGSVTADNMERILSR